MKTFIVLQNIVTFRADWQRLAAPGQYALCLLTGEQGWANLSDAQKACFDRIDICHPYDQTRLEQACRTLLQERHLSDMDEVRILTNDEYFLGHAALLRERFSIPGPDHAAILPFINKLRMKEVMSKGGVPVPRAVPFLPERHEREGEDYCRELAERLGFPIFAKQVDSAGSERIAKLADAQALARWCQQHAGVSNYELDEFLDGDLYHVDALVYRGEVRSLYLCRYSHPNAEFINGKPVGSLPLSPEDPLHARLVAFNHQVFRALGQVPDGATHLELFHTRDDRLVFLEIAARAPGGWIPQMHARCSGRNIEEQHFLAQMGRLPPPDLETGEVAAWVWYPQRPGQHAHTRHPLPLQSQHQASWEVAHGAPLIQPQSVRDRIGGVLLWSRSRALLEADFRWLVEEFCPYQAAKEQETQP